MADSEIYIIVLGLKIALSLGLVVLAFTLDVIAKKGEKHIHGLNVMAVALFIMALFEFFEDIAGIYSGLPSWLGHDLVNSWVKLSTLALAGLGIIWYLFGVNKNIKDYY
jgi:hypothetical protein